MSDRGVSTGPTSVGDYAAILWRRKLLVLPIVICVPVIAVVILSFQKAVYQASADVLLRTDSVSATLALIPGSGQDPQRVLDTQARLARLPTVAQDAIAHDGLRLSPAEFLAHSTVSADPNANVLTFAGSAGSPTQAIRLANAYADAYTRYRAAFDRQPIAQALETLRSRLQKLRDAGVTGASSLYTTLLAQQRQLLAIQALPSQDAVVVARADAAVQTAPQRRAGVLVGLIVGMLLAVAAALVREALEKRPRSTAELPERLDLRVLGADSDDARGGSGTVALTHPASIDAEAYRLLRMNFDHATANGGKVFAVTSAIGREGKSTVSANLAVTLARAGRSVILVDCDPLRPVLRERFRSGSAPGLAELALGTATVYDALTPIPLPTIGSVYERQPGSSSRSLGTRPGPRQRETPRRAGGLQIVTCNPTPLELGDFIVTTRLEWVLNQLRREAEVVILDSAPLMTSLGVGVAGLADGVIVVTNVALVRRPILDQLAQTLDELPTPKLGLVVTGVPPDTAAYGYYSTSASAEEPAASADIASAYANGSTDRVGDAGDRYAEWRRGQRG